MLRQRIVVVSVACALVAGACGSSGPTPAPATDAPAGSAAAVATNPPTPAPTPTPTPAPTASPSAAPSASAAPSVADVSASFNKAITDAFFAPHIVVKGATTVGATTTPTESTIDLQYGVVHATATSITNGKPVTSETIRTGTKAYERKFGAWFVATTPAPNLAALLKVGGYQDSGMDTHDGTSLHHMTLPAGTAIPAEALALPAAVASTAVLTLEAWADDAGKPVAMRLSATWDQPAKSGSQPATAAFDLSFAGTAPAVAAPNPDEVWVYRTSSLFRYKIAYPAGWEVKRGSKKIWDTYNGYDGSGLGARGDAAGSLTLNTLTSYAIRHPGQYTGLTNAKATTPKPARLAGAPARTFDIHGRYKGSTWWVMEVVATHGSRIYVVSLLVPRKPSATDRALFATFLATFSYK